MGIRISSTNPSQQGTVAARPAASAVIAGTIYFATDVNGGTLYMSNGATWQRLAPGAVAVNAELATDSVDAAQIKADAVGAAEIAANAVGTSEIANNSVTSQKIATGAVTEDSIGTDAVGADELQVGAVANINDIVDDLIHDNHIADNQITSAAILDGTIATADIGENQVTSSRILDGTVSGADIQDGSVASADITDKTVAAADMNMGSAAGLTIVSKNASGDGYLGQVRDELGLYRALGSTMLAFTCSPMEAGNALTLSDAQLRACAVYIDRDMTVTGLKLYVTTAGVGTWATAKVGLLNSAGSRIAISSNDTAFLKTAGVNNKNFTATVALNAGDVVYPVVLLDWSSMSTAPALAARVGQNDGDLSNLLCPASAPRCTNFSGQSDIAASYTLSSGTTAGYEFFAALF